MKRPTLEPVAEIVEDEPSGGSDGKRVQLNISVRKGQLAFWQDAAAEEGVTVSAWIKRICTQAALEVFAEIDGKYGRRGPKGT